MKIAIVTSQMEPTTGGSHTFEAAILDGVSRQSSTHSFLYLDLQGAILKRQPGTLVDWESINSLPAPCSEHPEADGLSSPDSAGSTEPAEDNHNSDNRFAETITKENIDFLWYPTPECNCTLIPCAMTVWDLQHRTQPYFPEVRNLGWTWDDREAFFSRYLPQAAAVVVGTEVGKQEIIRYYGVNPANILVNPLPLPPDFAAPELGLSGDRELLEPALEEAPENCFFLYPAQYWPHKNHANLILALAMLRDLHGLKPKLVLTGHDMGNRGYIDSLIANLELADQVEQLGFISRAELSALYSQARALVYPSFFGPDNLPPLEAFAHRCPVLTSDGEGPREQLGDAALFFDPANPADIAAGMQQLLCDENLRRELVQRGKQLVRDRTVEAYVQRMIGFFDRFEAIRFTWPAGYRHT